MNPRRSLWLALALPLLIAGGGCVTTSDIEDIQSQLRRVEDEVGAIRAETSSKVEVQGLQQEMSDRMKELLRVEADMQIELSQLSGQIDQLEASLEDTNYRLDQLSKQISAVIQQLTAASAGVGPSPGTSTAPVSDPRAMYDAAYSDYLRGNYDLAVSGFEQYLANFPDTDLADNAAYWIGESYFSHGRYNDAVQEFDRILTDFPRSDKRASALLKKGYAYLELGERQRGVAHLQQVLRDHPGTDEADLAQQRLDEIG